MKISSSLKVQFGLTGLRSESCRFAKIISVAFCVQNFGAFRFIIVALARPRSVDISDQTKNHKRYRYCTFHRRFRKYADARFETKPFGSFEKVASEFVEGETKRQESVWWLCGRKVTPKHQ